jgi:hypothetical protein
MSDNRQKLVHLRSAVEKIPQASDLNYGEIAIQYAKSKPVLYIKNTDNEIVKFIDEAAINTLLNGYVTSGYLTTNYATSADTYAAITAVTQQLTNVYTYKGSVASYENLPTENQKIGDVYNVEAAHGNIPPGTNYAWNGSAWDSLGGSVDLSNYATTGSVNTLSGYIETLSAATVDLEASAHTHDNISVLNGIGSQDVDNWNAAYASAHSHSNIDVLTGITSQKVADWDEAAASAHTHDNMDALAGITTAKTQSWDEAAASAHTHANADVLDTITSAKTEQWDSAYTLSQSALVGIESGKDRGASVNASNELDFTGLYIDCGTY